MRRPASGPERVVLASIAPWVVDGHADHRPSGVGRRSIERVGHRPTASDEDVYKLFDGRDPIAERQHLLGVEAKLHERSKLQLGERAVR